MVETEGQLVAMRTYGKEMQRDPLTGAPTSALKCTVVVASSLLMVCASSAREISPRRATYHYLLLTPPPVLHQNWLLLRMTEEQLATIASICRQAVFHRIYRWDQDHWSEFPSRDYADFRDARTFPTASQPRFVPSQVISAYIYRLGAEGHEVTSPDAAPLGASAASPTAAAEALLSSSLSPSPSTQGAEGAIKIEQSANWWWISGDTYQHRQTLKAAGARWSARRQQWYFIGSNLPPAIQELYARTSAPASASVHTPFEPSTAHGQGIASRIAEAEVDAEAKSGATSNNHGQDQLEPDKHISSSPAAIASRSSEKAAEIPSIVETRGQATGLTISESLTDNSASALGATLPAEPAQALTPALPAIRLIPPPAPSTMPYLAALSDTQASNVEAKEANDAKSLSAHPSGLVRPSGPLHLRQQYLGEVTGSISGNVHCYGYAVHAGICVYLNMGGPRTAVEAIRARLAKGEMVNVVPWDAPTMELTAGEQQTGKYTAYLQHIPEARFTSVILVHDWITQPEFNGVGTATTFLFRVDVEQAMQKLRQLVTELVKIPVFEAWTSYLWHAGRQARLVQPTESAGSVDLLTVTLDREAWTTLIAGGLASNRISLPMPMPMPMPISTSTTTPTTSASTS